MAKSQKKSRTRRSMVPVVSANVSPMARVLGLDIVRKVDLDAGFTSLAEAIETDNAQLVEAHLTTRARLLASTKAMEAKVLEAK